MTETEMSRIFASCSAVARGALGLCASCAAVARLNSASNMGCTVLNVANTITPIAIETKSRGGHTLLFCRRRNTPAGEMKMSIRSSQNDWSFAGADAGAAGIVED